MDLISRLLSSILQLLYLSTIFYFKIGIKTKFLIERYI